MSLEDLIKKDKTSRRQQRGGAPRRGDRGGFRGNRGDEGNLVPRFKKGSGIFKKRQGGGGPARGGRGDIELPPRSGGPGFAREGE